MPNQPLPDDFSFDTYEDLDASLEAALDQNIDPNTITANDVVTDGLQAAISKHTGLEDDGQLVDPEIISWARGETINAVESWMFYDTNSATHIVSPMMHEIEQSPNYAEKIEYLWTARQALFTSGETTDDGVLNIADSMSFVLIPWKIIHEKIEEGTFSEWTSIMRQAQALLPNAGDHEELDRLVTQDLQIYHDPDDPTVMLSAKEYVQKRLKSDGPWGIALVQTSQESGVTSLAGKTPDELTNNGNAPLKIAGIPVDGLGIFEWLALTLQENPRIIKNSWLIANLVQFGESGIMPGGFVTHDRQGFSMIGGNSPAASDNFKLRLAVT